MRLATPRDAPLVAALVTGRGLPLDGLGSAWRTWVATDREQVVGTASLERHDDALLLRGVAVAPDRAGAVIGARLVGAALLPADGIGPVALLTETAAGLQHSRCVHGDAWGRWPVTGLLDGLAVLCGVAGLGAGLLVLGVSRSGLLALRVALDFWTAAALLRTVGPVSWQRVAGAAAVVGLRQLLSLRRR